MLNSRQSIDEISLLQLGGGGISAGDSLGGLGDIFGGIASQSYVPPQEVILT